MNETTKERKWRERFSGAKRKPKTSGKKHQLRNSPEGVTILADKRRAVRFLFDRDKWELTTMYSGAIQISRRDKVKT